MSRNHCSICGQTGHNKLFHIKKEVKQCCVCKCFLPFSEFAKTRKNLKHTISNSYFSSTCKECDKRKSHQRYRSTFKNRFGYLLASIKNRCKNNKTEFAITVKDLLMLLEKQNQKCFFTGIPLSLETGDNAISIDRKDPNKGYTVDNIALTIWLVNNMKGHLDNSQFINMCRLIVENVS